jgi:hypothetical protein
MGGGRGFPGGRAGGMGGLGLIVAAILALLFGINPGVLFQGPGDVQVAPGQVETTRSPEEDRLAAFVSAVLAETEDTWNEAFAEVQQDYREPTLVLFSGMVQSACGMAQAAVGPFYCPADQKVYLDLSFFDEMHRRFGAAGDFAQAYVVAHEVGHHVQTLLGVTQQVEQLRRSSDQTTANMISVRFELQADCLAGVWANRTQQRTRFLEEGDIEEALNAASAIGDDRMQRRAQGYVVPDAFTHGSSEQRARWFMTGLRAGDFAACDTFNTDQL